MRRHPSENQLRAEIERLKIALDIADAILSKIKAEAK